VDSRDQVRVYLDDNGFPDFGRLWAATRSSGQQGRLYEKERCSLTTPLMRFVWGRWLDDELERTPIRQSHGTKVPDVPSRDAPKTSTWYQKAWNASSLSPTRGNGFESMIRSVGSIAAAISRSRDANRWRSP